jgi:hypothetical protein
LAEEYCTIPYGFPISCQYLGKMSLN